MEHEVGFGVVAWEPWQECRKDYNIARVGRIQGGRKTEELKKCVNVFVFCG